MHYCYILRNIATNKTYNGYTVNPKRRIRQHNQELKGGAKYTTRYEPNWEIYLIIGGFPDKHNAMQCEWKIKHPTNKKRTPVKYTTPEGRIMGLNDILKQTKWTNNSQINISELRLDIWVIDVYSYLLTDMPSNININIVTSIDLTKI